MPIVSNVSPSPSNRNTKKVEFKIRLHNEQKGKIINVQTMTAVPNVSQEL